MITLIKRKVSVCDKLKIRVRKRETKHAIFTEIQIFGIFSSLDLDTPPTHTHRINRVFFNICWMYSKEPSQFIKPYNNESGLS